VDTDRPDSRTFSTRPRRLACVFPSHSGTCFHPNQSSLGRPDESTTSVHHCHCRVQTQCAFIQPRASVSRTCLHPRLCMRNSQTPSGHAVLPRNRDATLHTTTFSLAHFHICSPPAPSGPTQDSLHSRIANMCRCNVCGAPVPSAGR
jgi:hypothetical protein